MARANSASAPSSPHFISWVMAEGLALTLKNRGSVTTGCSSVAS